jgi:S1-C subfamily serine protease
MRPRRLSLTHLSGSRRGETDDVSLPAQIGSEAGQSMVVPGTAERHALVFERGHEVVVQDAGSGRGIWVKGEAVEEAVLRDGDVLELGADGPALQVRDPERSKASLLRSFRWARPARPVGRSDAFGLLRVLARETKNHTSHPFRLAIVISLAVGAAALGWGAWQSHKLRLEVLRLQEAMRLAAREQALFRARVEDERQRLQDERHARATEAEEFRVRVQDLNRRLAEAQAGEVEAVRSDLEATRERISSLETEKAAGERIIREYGPGVCLIQGSFMFVDAEGRSLRYVLDEAGQPRRSADGHYSLDALGTGEVHSLDYVGTGFLVDGHGLILTNRHVAEPWWKDGSAQAALAQGAKPQALWFRAFFPRESQAFELAVVRVSESVDLALVRVDLKGRKVPVLPLDRSGRTAVAGSPVVVLGYPAGLEAILAKAEAAAVSDIVDGSGMNPSRIAEGLAAQRLIRPSATQGHIGDVTKTDIVFDAQTTHGGSGGPVLDRSGHVIAVEYAVLTSFGGSSFGVPVRYALELLSGKSKEGG